MAPPSLLPFRRHQCCCFTIFQIAEKRVERARQLLKTGKAEDVEAALVWLEEALERCRPPADHDMAMELKARALLRLKRYREVVEMLHSYVPSLGHNVVDDQNSAAAEPNGAITASLGSSSCSSPPHSTVSCSSIFSAETDRHSSISETVDASSSDSDQRRRKNSRFRCFPVIFCTLKPRKAADKQQLWRNLVLGQACWHLGMLEDAMALLQQCKHTASAASRRRSNCIRDDIFFCNSDQLYCKSQIMSSRKSRRSRSVAMAAAGESEMVTQILSNIKFLLRRRAAAVAALEAGLYGESVRHFSKLIDGRKSAGTPQGFIADCYLHRAIAYQATGRVVDAIADCNRSLALNPHSAIKALSIRASLYEMVRCYSDCLLDLQQLKMIYEAALRYRMMQLQQERGGNGHGCSLSVLWASSEQTDFAGGLDYINGKITATRQRLSRSSGDLMIDAHTILQMPRNCSREDVQRAYLLLSLKHKADRSSQANSAGKPPCPPLDRGGDDAAACEDMAESAKEEGTASALRLAQLIHKAYLKLLSAISEREIEAESRAAQKMRRGQKNSEGGGDGERQGGGAALNRSGRSFRSGSRSSRRTSGDGGAASDDSVQVTEEEGGGGMAQKLATALSEALRSDVSGVSGATDTWTADRAARAVRVK